MIKVKEIRQTQALESKGLAAEITDIDLRQPIEASTAAELRSALDEYPVLVFHNQFVDYDNQLAFTRVFGEPHITYDVTATRFKRRIDKPAVSDIANLDADDQILKENDERRIFALSNKIWHTDTTFKKIPSKVGVLAAKEIPSSGGNTEFADMRAAWDELPQATKDQVASLTAEHSNLYSRGRLGVKFTEEDRKRFPPVPHPLVRLNKVTGRKSLYLSSHASHIIGLPVEEGRALIQSLTEFATQPRFCYIHRWKVGDLVIWDNRCTMHRAAEYEEFKERRVLSRTGVDEKIAPVEVGGSYE